MVLSSREPFPSRVFFNLAEEVGELLHVVPIDGGDFIHQRRVVAVMREAVVAFRHADFAVRAVASLARKHKGRNAGGVSLQRDREQVEHQPRMICKLDRNSVGLGEARRGDGIGGNLALHHFHLTLHFADGGEIFVEFAPVGCAETTLQAARVIGNQIENALLIPGVASAGGGIASVFVPAEQAFEYRARIHFGRIGNGGVRQEMLFT